MSEKKKCTSCRLKKFKGSDKHLRCISGIFLFRGRACFCNPVWCLLLTFCFINKVLCYFIWMCRGFFFFISAIHQIVSTLLLSCPPTTTMFQQYLKEETVWLKTNFSSVPSPHAWEPESPKKNPFTHISTHTGSKWWIVLVACLFFPFALVLMLLQPFLPGYNSLNNSISFDFQMSTGKGCGQLIQHGHRFLLMFIKQNDKTALWC